MQQLGQGFLNTEDISFGLLLYLVLNRGEQLVGAVCAKALHLSKHLIEISSFLFN